MMAHCVLKVVQPYVFNIHSRSHERTTCMHACTHSHTRTQTKQSSHTKLRAYKRSHTRAHIERGPNFGAHRKFGHTGTHTRTRAMTDGVVARIRPCRRGPSARLHTNKNRKFPCVRSYRTSVPKIRRPCTWRTGMYTYVCTYIKGVH